MKENEGYMNVAKHNIKYNSRYSKNVSKPIYKKLILGGLIATIGVTSVYGTVQIVNDFTNTIEYNNSVSMYYDLIVKHTFRTDDLKHSFIDTYSLSQDIKKLEVLENQDLYHHLINIAMNIEYDRSKNFWEIVNDLDLDLLAQQNNAYPTYEEFYTFLSINGLLNEDGSINFRKWLEYDKKAFALDREYEKDGKSL